MSQLESEITRLAGEVQAEKVNMVKAREAIRESRQEAERLDAKLKVAVASASKPVKQSDLQMQLDETLAVLKCSTCKQSVRSIILSKCLHSTFRLRLLMLAIDASFRSLLQGVHRRADINTAEKVSVV